MPPVVGAQAQAMWRGRIFLFHRLPFYIKNASVLLQVLLGRELEGHASAVHVPGLLGVHGARESEGLQHGQ